MKTTFPFTLCVALFTTGCAVGAGDYAVKLGGTETASAAVRPAARVAQPAEARVVTFINEPTDAPSPFDEGVYIDERHAWVGGPLKRTSDGGQTWQLMRPSPGDEASFGRIEQTYARPYFITPEQGWLKSGGVLWRTEDGGQTWSRVLGESYLPQFADERHGWMSVFVGELSQQSYVTQDGGQRWEPCGPVLSLNSQHPDGKAYFITPKVGWVITTRSVERQTIYGVARTSDGGCSWRQLWTSYDDPDERYGDIYFLNEREGWLTGKANGSLHHTADGGRSWKNVALPSESMKVTGVYFTSSKEGWIIARTMVSKDAEGMLYTDDGGETWRKLTRDEVIAGFDVGGRHNEIPAKWQAGKLIQMIYASANGPGAD